MDLLTDLQTRVSKAKTKPIMSEQLLEYLHGLADKGYTETDILESSIPLDDLAALHLSGLKITHRYLMLNVSWG